MSSRPAPDPQEERIAELERALAKAERINRVLMERVERATDLQGNAFSLFETAITLESKVRDRTADLERALAELAASNAELVAAKAAADDAERRLSDAIASINEGFALFDAEDRLVLYNETYLGLWPDFADRIRPGVTFADTVRWVAETGGTLGARQAPDRWLSDRVARHRVAEGGHVHVLPDGRYIQVNELRTSEGGIVGIYTDITDVKAEDARQRAEALAVNAELQRQIAERLAAEAAMQEAKTAAEEANISKTRFLAAASHDLLQPLNAARLFVSAISDRRLAPPTRALVRQTGSALDSVEDLLEALLEISKLDAGAIVPQPTDFALSDLLKLMHAEFGPMARERGVAFEITPSPLWVRTDMRLARRILQNLISNALRYTDAGSVSISCHPAGQSVRIAVRDTGVGIAEEHQSVIFEEFRRLSDNGRDKGMGLGLAIVQRAARMIGAEIGLRSELGKGSTFSVTLPLTEARADSAASPSLRRVSSAADRAVLVIDNEAAILAGMAAMLSGWGYRVTGARDAADAIAAIDGGFAPDWVVADYHLDHGRTGDAAVADVRARLGAELPAIVITADRTPELRDRLTAAGFACLTKPVKPAQLRALLSRPIA